MVSRSQTSPESFGLATEDGIIILVATPNDSLRLGSDSVFLIAHQ
jgi:hypothetical protein